MNEDGRRACVYTPHMATAAAAVGRPLYVRCGCCRVWLVMRLYACACCVLCASCLAVRRPTFYVGVVCKPLCGFSGDAWPPQGGGPVQHLKTKTGFLPGPAGQTSSQASDDSTVRPIPAARRAPQAILCAPAQSARPSLTLFQPSTLRRLTSCDVQGCLRVPVGARQQHQTDRLRPEPCKALAAMLTIGTQK
jgi:hypothetical protein